MSHIKYARIIEFILDFYSLQPGINEELLEKLELYLVLINSLYVDAMEELDALIDIAEEDLFEEILEVLNGFLNALGEEHEKIFPERENTFQIIPVFSCSAMDSLRFLETLNSWNGREKDSFGISTQLHAMQLAIEADPLDEKLLWASLRDIVERIYIKMIIRTEDLI